MHRMSGRSVRLAPAECRRPGRQARRTRTPSRLSRLVEIVELCTHRSLGSGPQHLIDVGVDTSYDVLRVNGTGGNSGAHLLETLLAVRQVVVEHSDGLVELWPMSGQQHVDVLVREVTQPLQRAQ